MALAIGRLVYALPFVFNPRRFDWLHASYAISLVLFSFQVWWRSWGYSDVESWTLLKMIVLILPNIFIYLSALFLVGETPGKVRSWAKFLDDFRPGDVWRVLRDDACDPVTQLLPRRHALPGIPGIAATLMSLVGLLRRNRPIWWLIVVFINLSFLAVVLREL